MPQRVGLKHIAEHLGLDVSTVSRALRADPRVKPETSEVVRDAAQRMGYRPNAMARALKGGTTNRVAVLLSPPQQRFASPIFLELLSTLDQRLRGTGRSLAVFAAQERAEEIDIVRAVVEDRLADAIVLGRTRQDDPRVAYLMEAGFPFVTFGRTQWEREHPWVEIDYARAGEVAVEALASAKPDALHILCAPDGLRFADNYVTGAKRAALKAGLANVHTHRIEMTETMGEEVALDLLTQGCRFALACIQDSLAFGVYRAAAKLNVRLGADAAVFGGQNFPGSEHTAPPLSTFSTEDSRVAALLSDIVLKRLDEPQESTEETGQVIEPRPLLRGSHLLAD
jgi:LacI family transcriptional regulator